MKLNANIVFKQLEKHFKAELRGQTEATLNLSPPELYLGHHAEFLADHLYLASANQLPAYPKLQKGVAIVCVGDTLRLSYYASSCTVIVIKEHCDIFSVYLKIQEIFNFFDAWNDRLFDLYKKDADIQNFLECSTQIFRNPLIVIDQDFHFLASTASAEALGEKWRDESKNLSQYSIDHFLTENSLQTNVKDPIFLKIVDTNALCVNLYDKRDVYIGCFCILISEDYYSSGMEALAVYLARIIEQTIQKNPFMLVTEHNTLKNALRDLIHDVSINPNQRWYLHASHENTQYICITLHSLNQENFLPSTYICNIFEAAFPNSLAFPVESVIVGVVDIQNLHCDGLAYQSKLDEILLPLLQSLKLRAGISNVFSSLYYTKIYYRQAEAAIENGSMLKPQEYRYHFSDYALMEMVINSLSGHPVETYFPNGLKKLYDHDNDSTVSYLETLKVFLEENMSVSKAASILYVHRSTLVDRIARIERDLDIDLHDPDKRLQLQLLLKAIEIQDSIKENSIE